MKREFLEKLLKDKGVEDYKELIDSIMEENGKDIETAKGELDTITADRDRYKEQYETAAESLEKFKDIDPEKLKGEIETLQQTIRDKDDDYAAKIADMEFNSIIEKSVAKAGAKNAKAVMALLDLEALKKSNNQQDDINAALETVKKDNDYMFGSNEPINNAVGPTGGGGGGNAQYEAMRAVAGLPPEKK